MNRDVTDFDKFRMRVCGEQLVAGFAAFGRACVKIMRDVSRHFTTNRRTRRAARNGRTAAAVWYAAEQRRRCSVNREQSRAVREPNPTQTYPANASTTRQTDESRREKPLRIRLSSPERQKIDDAAKATGISSSKWARQILLAAAEVVRKEE